MKPIFRLCQIKFILLRYGLDELLTKLPKRRWLRGLVYLNPYHYCPSNKHNSTGVRLRLALTALGPIFVKFGQVLSTRRDLLPAAIADELALLQDRVPPFPGAEAQALLEKAYGRKLDSIFRRFNVEPLASASIAQVHVATLLDGTEVVVKIVRPNLATAIKRDIALLYWLAAWMERLWTTGKRLQLKNVVAEFERCTWHELDLLREAASASQLRRNFADSTKLYIPAIYWSYTHKHVLVIERIHGIPIGDTAALRQANIDLKKLAEHCVEVFFTQVFQHCFFHADMHPGNLFVSAHNPANPQLIAVDFGIMGSLSPHDQRYLAENFLAFFKRDYRRVAQLHIESGWIPAATRLEEFEAAVRCVCEPVFERPLKDISCGQLLLQLFQTAEQFKMVLQPQLVLLQKTLLNIEGLSRQLYPDLDLWHTAKPVLTKWLKQQLGPRAFLRKIRENAPFWAEKLPELPELVHNALKQASIAKTALQPEQPAHLRGIKRYAFYQGVCVAVLCLAIVIGFTLFWLNL